MTDRHTLESDLARYRERGDLAAQAETLMALGHIANDEEEYELAQGLYGQAWAIYEKIGDQRGVARAMRAIGNLMLGRILGEVENVHLWNEATLTLALEIRDYQTQAETYLAMLQRGANRVMTFNLYVMAFACYHLLGEIPSDVSSPKTLSDAIFHHTKLDIRQQELTRERALDMYRALGDIRCEAHIILAFADTEFWAKDYDRARADFGVAKDLFQALGDQEHLKYILLRLKRLAQNVNDYELYQACHEQMMACLTAEPSSYDTLALWLELATIAIDHHDCATARAAYQCAAMYSVLLGEPERQSRIYWQWGQMEYSMLREMGEALCQWSIALVEKYDPDHVSAYQRELRQMREKSKK